MDFYDVDIWCTTSLDVDDAPEGGQLFEQIWTEHSEIDSPRTLDSCNKLQYATPSSAVTLIPALVSEPTSETFPDMGSEGAKDGCDERFPKANL